MEDDDLIALPQGPSSVKDEFAAIHIYARDARLAAQRIAALTAENAALAAKVNCPRHAAQVIIDEVLQKPCHEAKKLRISMIDATMKARIGGVTSSQRWGVVNAAIRALRGATEEAGG